jgi:hypothetical protein
MPNVADHILQARHNEDFYRATDKNAYSDWAMTAVYYAALQYVDAYLARIGMIDPGGHDVRDQELHRRPELRPIINSYFRLKSRSRSARYYCATFPLPELQRSYEGDLTAIRKHLLPMASSK